MDYTFSQHMSLAREWVRYNGKQGTDKQALRAMRILTAEALVRMLTARCIVLPAGCKATQAEAVR